MRRVTQILRAGTVIASLSALGGLTVRAQEPTTQSTVAPPHAGSISPATTQPEEVLITLNFPDSVPLKTLIDYVSQRLKMNILYDDQVANKRLTIKAPAKVPESALLGLLESALKMNDLALTDADQKGWKRVVPAQNLVAIARAPGEEAAGAAGGAVTQMYIVKHADLNRVDALIKPFLTGKGANTVILPERSMLIVTDYGSNMDRISQIIKIIDQPRTPIVMQFLQAKHLDANALSQHATALLNSKFRTEGGKGANERLEILTDSRTNQLVLIGTKEDIDQATAIISTLDVEIPTQTKIYQFKSASPERVDRLVKEFIGEFAAKTRYQSAVDKEGGALIVTATPDIHARIEALQKQIDLPVAEVNSPVRFYKLTNTTAGEVLHTIQSIEGLETAASGNGEPVPEPATRPQGPTPAPADTENKQPVNPAAPVTPTSSDFSPIGSSTTMPAGAVKPAPPAGSGPQSIQTKHARITADTNTNTIIVVADPGVQVVYEHLIRQLDKRRPQVLLECILVTLDTGNGFSLGVEISGKGHGNPNRPDLAFSSFGLSTVDPNTGALTLKPGLGFNGAFLSAEIADVVIRAVSNHSRARVVSAPRILVNDNATGTLASVNEAPFTSINASNTVSTTSFAGYATAGTTITLTPHISEGDHLQIEYQVTLSSFTGAAGTNAPPPRQTNTVQSKVTIPDGSTIVVGGLNRMDESNTATSIPVIDQIPIFNLLATNRTNNKSIQSLFVFIRPIVLRDDEFEDLKYFSARDASVAELPPDMPESEPLIMP